ncbi:MAG: M24 family metallopeptidase [Caldilineaceae bacterium]
MTTVFKHRHAKINALRPLSTETRDHYQHVTRPIDETYIASEYVPSRLAQAEWQARGLETPKLQEIRLFRLERIRQKLQELDYAGIVVVDPMNIRYAVDAANMQVWTLHNPMRYCFIPTEGPVILFDYSGCGHLSNHLALITEVRPAKSWSYIIAAQRVDEMVERWAAELADLVTQYGGGNRRLAMDRCNPEGVWALERKGVQLCNGEEVMELARVIKSDEEIKAMRCAVVACEEAMRVMQEKLVPGITELRLWSYLHAENVARGGEWLEARLLNSGPRTNPWYQECSDRVIEAGDLVAFDTDLIGPYGICADISRTWLCGDGKPSAEQKRLYQLAYEQIQYNKNLLKAGMSFREITEKARSLPDDCMPNRYSLLYHGVGMGDEYPDIFYLRDWEKFASDGILAKNMVLCVESYVGVAGGKEGVKLEEQLLITETGVESLSSYPYEADFLS